MNNKTMLNADPPRTPTSRPTRRRAAALIEMALILPVLVVIVLICIDFGRFATVYTAVTNAAREGANFGGTHPFTAGTSPLWQQKINEAAQEEMSGIPGFDIDNMTVSEPEVIASNQRARVRVEVSYVFRPATFWPLMPSEMTITRIAEMPVVR